MTHRLPPRLCLPAGRLWVLAGGLAVVGIVALGPPPAGSASAGRPTPAPPPGQVQRASEQIQRGAVLYATRCASCHGTAGRGTAQAPPLRGVGAASLDFMLATGRMPMADPHQPMLRQAPQLPPGDIQALIAYVLLLAPGGPPIPPVDPQRGDLPRGRRLFAANCAACHGASGQGAAVSMGQVAPPLEQATPTQIAEAVRIGPAPMPRFGPNELSADDLNAIVRYVLFLRAAPDPGGAGLGHEGPVIEGFIAWLVGLGLMVAAIRLIGTTT